MADADDSDADEEAPPRGGSLIRPEMTGRRVMEMDVIGWLIFLGMLVIMLPLLPAIIVVVALLKLLGLSGERTFSWRRRVNRRPRGHS